MNGPLASMPKGWNDHCSSFRIIAGTLSGPSAGEVWLYQGENYQGPCWSFGFVRSPYQAVELSTTHHLVLNELTLPHLLSAPPHTYHAQGAVYCLLLVSLPRIAKFALELS